VGREVGPEVVGAFLALHRSGELPAYDPKAFRHALTRASEHLIPAEVSPLSIDQLLTILSNLIDAKDPYTAGHSRRVAALAVAVAAQLGMQEHTKATLWAGGYLHDLGKLRVPLRILTKRGTLTRAEFEQVKAHPSDGAAMLQSIPSLRHLTTGARYHHERWDGSGYPEGLKGENIPLVGQVLAVCDCYDAMTSRRTHRSFMTHEEAMDYVARNAGVHFSPRIADAFLSLPEPLFERVGHQPERRRVVPVAERRVARRSTPHRSIPAARAG
jgi:HD-GYP domain-containing protein (c-di-GMP phosphodiesterase class II)